MPDEGLFAQEADKVNRPATRGLQKVSRPLTPAEHAERIASRVDLAR